ncbi:MAG TPA: hypothetical protein VKR54_01650 [Candidatus Babeliales bacterium]|jgi:hypothetical protein|nr:hypothetical protein [Candidatus Babeliales bacterium]
MMYYIIAALTISCALSSHSINAHSFQEKDTSPQNQDHLIISLQKELRTPEYRKEILPNDFSYLSILVTYGTSTNQPPAYLRSIVKLFSNMLKSSHYVNASAFSRMLETLPTELTPYFTLSASREYINNSALYDATFFDRFNATVQTVLYSKFSTEYDSFRQDPDLFLKKIAGNIVTIAHEEIIQEQLRQGVIRFCEIALSKLIWDPTAQEQTWLITKKIAEQLVTLLEHNILDDTNDLDDLHWTLLNRYCYFVELTATDMPESFYTTIKNDIRSKNDIVLFALKEQDYIVEPKLSYMQRTLLEAETAAYRHRSGLAHA